MKGINTIVVIMLTVLNFAGVGYQKSERQISKDIVTFQMLPSSNGVKDFMNLLGDYDLGYDSDICYNITPSHISKRYGFNIFKFDKSCGSFLLYENEVYPLGKWFGGSGVTSFAVADLNTDGKFELFFTYSWGSGIHHSLVGYFDTADKKILSFDFTDTNFNSDLVLETDKDNTLCIYTANSNNKSFVDMEMYAEDKLASIIWDSGKISIAEEGK